MKAAPLVGVVTCCGLLLAASMSVHGQVQSAAKRLETGSITPDEPAAAVAQDAEEAYCTAEFKEVLRKVLHACGLAEQGGRRGCQPADIKNLATISDDDFNALFNPLKDRGAVLMFDSASEELDDESKKIVESQWKKRKGARYFFVVARASKSGTVEFNRSLSHRRANSVLLHVEDTFDEKELDKEMGLLWLGKEYAQLDEQYCEWNVSRPKQCNAEAINRSAFVSWVDCRL